MSDTVERVKPGDLSWEEYGVEHVQRYDFFAEYYRNKNVLDAACGTGYGSQIILNNGANSVDGIDLSEEAIQYCKQNFSGVNFSKFDCSHLEKLDKKYDLIVSFETIEHLNDPKAFISSASKIINSGGHFICSTPNKKRLSGAGHINEFHLNELSFDEFKESMSQHFEIIDIYHQSESLNYFRYQEVKYLLLKTEGRSNAFFFNRLEIFFRKLFNKDFKKEEFYHPYLNHLSEEDISINVLKEPKDWHKTFIIVGRKK